MKGRAGSVWKCMEVCWKYRAHNECSVNAALGYVIQTAVPNGSGLTLFSLGFFV